MFIGSELWKAKLKHLLSIWTFLVLAAVVTIVVVTMFAFKTGVSLEESKRYLGIVVLIAWKLFMSVVVLIVVVSGPVQFCFNVAQYRRNQRELERSRAEWRSYNERVKWRGEYW